MCCWPWPWRCSRPCPGWRDPGSLGRLGAVAHVRAEGRGAKLPRGMSVSEWVVMHSLTCSRMREELAEARKGFSLAASGVAQPLSLAEKGSDLARSSRRCCIHKGAARIFWWPGGKRNSEPKGAQSPDEAALLPGKSCWGLCLPLSWLWLKQLACGDTTGRGQGWFSSKAGSKARLASPVHRVMLPP